MPTVREVVLEALHRARRVAEKHQDEANHLEILTAIKWVERTAPVDHPAPGPTARPARRQLVELARACLLYDDEIQARASAGQAWVETDAQTDRLEVCYQRWLDLAHTALGTTDAERPGASL